MKPARETDPKTLEMLVCPVTKTRLFVSPEAPELISSAARLAFPIRDGIALLVPDEARALTEEELVRLET